MDQIFRCEFCANCATKPVHKGKLEIFKLQIIYTGEGEKDKNFHMSYSLFIGEGMEGGGMCHARALTNFEKRRVRSMVKT